MALSRLGKWLYGAAFVVVLPAGLAAWANATADTVHLPLLPPLIGLPIAATGAGLILWGMLDLWRYGGGLPMNACPPPHYVERGVYRLLPHPIYTGFVMLCAGASAGAGSASGLWLVSPVVALGCAALTLGYEDHDLAERFGRAPRNLLPKAGAGHPSPHDRIAVFLFVFAPWAALYEAVIAIGARAGATALWFPLEVRLPVIEWFELFYFSAYLGAVVAPLFARTRDDLRRFCTRGLWAMLIAFPVYFAVPLAAPQRAFTPHSALGRLLVWERTLDNSAGAFPSFHVIWATLAAGVYISRWPRRAWVFRLWAALVAASCILTGQHPITDVVGGLLTVWLVARGPVLWQAVRNRGERIANSWHEWRIGPVRVINHGIYAGIGAAVALWIALTLVGPGRRLPVVVAALAAVVMAALWAQFVEGSPQLSRPFGFYGGLIGGTAGALLAPFFGVSVWLVLAAFAAAGPWAQAIGRLRCLVQGCCHGRPAPKLVGIRYTHPRSRVCRMTPWTGVPLHPTPIYSILCNGFIALVIARLWLLHAPLHLIAGLYFILNGLGRFVEEAWRGEPQTAVLAGLRLYQWAAIASVFAGALMTALGPSDPAPAVRLALGALLPSAFFGVLVCCAMGVDFPESSRRFSRLA